MPTLYEGREHEHDLGGGHSFTWLHNETGELVGLMEHHPKGPNAPPGARYCGGYVAWLPAAAQAGIPRDLAVHHQLMAGAPGDEASLTVWPSLACHRCTSHGFIRDGRWTDA
jgi:hypothetical protein